MRFALLRKVSDNQVPASQGFTGRLIFVVYNIVYWVLMILPFTRILDYRTGFIAFSIFIIVRATFNLYRNNFLKSEQAGYFPFRSP